MQSQLKTLQRMGEDIAYTFKGLHKTADELQFKSKMYLVVPIIFSIVMLGFSEELNEIVLKSLAVISLIATCCLIINQKEYEKISSYRKLADQFKKLYDRLENDFYSETYENVEKLQAIKDEIVSMLNEYPISKKAYKQVQKTIKTEMNLEWLEVTNG